MLEEELKELQECLAQRKAQKAAEAEVAKRKAMEEVEQKAVEEAAKKAVKEAERKATEEAAKKAVKEAERKTVEEVAKRIVEEKAAPFREDGSLDSDGGGDFFKS